MRIIVFILFFSFFGLHQGWSASCTTTADGDFSDAAIWSCGSVPGKADNVTINHVVNLDVSFAGGGATSGTWLIAIGASLTSTTSDLDFKTGSNLTVNGTFEVDNLEFDNGSSVTFNSTANVVVHGNFTNNNNSNNVTVNTDAFNVKGNLSNGNGGSITGTGSIDVDGTVSNNAGGTLFSCSGVGCGCGTCVLAVELVDFQVKKIVSGAELAWVTGGEVRNDYFEVQKSLNGKDYQTISFVNGIGTSNDLTRYKYVDERFSGVTYYRIVDVDLDGIKTYHHSIILVEEDQTAKLAKVGVNLVIDNLFEGMELRLFNAQGNLVSSTVSSGKDTQLIDLSRFARGFMLAVLMDQEGHVVQSLKLIR